MEKPFKFLLPPPNFGVKAQDVAKQKTHFLTPSGMTLLPREKQPPPMYGKRGSTVPARFLQPVAQPEPAAPPLKQYCEPCELELHSVEELKRHRQQHEKCPVDGCHYRGHPTVMDRHVTALHNSGLFDKFKKLSTPEEIAAWREERRKRYPTVENVLMKQKAQEQRQKRGERLETNKSRFGKHDDRKRALPNSESKNDDDNKRGEAKLINKTQSNRSKNKRKRRNNRDTKDDKPKTDTNIQKTQSSCEEESACRMFRGTLGMKNYKHVNNKNKTPINNALFGLIGMYGSDDETEEEKSDNEENCREDISTHTSTLCDNGSHKPPDFTAVKEDIKNVNEITLDNSLITKINDDDPKEFPEQLMSSFQATSNNVSHSSHVCPKEEKHNLKMDSLEKEIQAGKGSTKNQNEIENQILSDLSKDSINDRENISELTLDNSVITKINGDNQNECLDELPEQLISSAKATSHTPTTVPIKDNSSDEGPEETPIVRSIPEYQIKAEKPPAFPAQPSQKCPKQTERETKAKLIVKRRSGLDYRRAAKMRKQNTMLEKLLEADIRHERNVLLQCVRYVCENNFFGVGKSTSNPNMP